MAVEFQDYYATLGVSRDATPEDIKKAFRKLARQYHPDHARDNPAAEEKFKRINEAYEVLRDPEKRGKYDRLGARWKDGDFRPPPHRGGATWDGGGAGSREFHFGGTGFSDFFEQFFGGGERYADFEEFFGAGGRSRRGGGGMHFPQQGADVEGDILVTLDEVFGGSTRTISLKRVNPRTGQEETDTIRVRIPPGVRGGQTIRVRGKGGEGAAGGEPGDLHLRVRMAAHPDFRIREADVYYDLDLAPWEAVLGMTAVVPVPGGGQVRLRVPPGSGGGRQLRLSGKGLPKGKSGGRGDLFVVVNVQTPESVTDEERELWEKLSRVSKFDPRSK